MTYFDVHAGTKRSISPKAVRRTRTTWLTVGLTTPDLRAIRRSQTPLLARVWEFESPLRHHDPTLLADPCHSHQVCQMADTPHPMRHTGITHLLEDGVPLKVVQEIAGHHSARTTIETYAHATETMQQQAVEAMNRRLG